MDLTIHDVDHGFCATGVSDTGRVLVFDCGHKSGTIMTSWYPSTELHSRGVRHVDLLAISHPDQDHVSAIEGLANTYEIKVLARNQTLGVAEIRALKTPPLAPSVEFYLRMIPIYETGPVIPGASLGAEMTYFALPYSPNASWNNENNLSMVTFIHHDGLGIILPGDLEEEGWLQLLQAPDFRANLERVNVFVASHHGRRNGYCADVFQYCRPQVIVFSDKQIVHETQQTAGLYAPHAAGIEINGTSRNVLTTRNDGSIRLTTSQTAAAQIQIGV